MDLIIKISGVNSKSLKKSITEPAIINVAATNLVLLTTITQNPLAIPPKERR
ncbi:MULTISPECIES: hypothetical protein [Winogradskyella]|uniref:hypothetical protein n=1 Tax=Winogradskyella TaxID=286104 RepID=UPI0015CD7742|nr:MULTISPECIES: hypothetical protein [Winogradskyella]QXP79991.1 hypothetical protein H0I32_04985 [Winogradskyella sp. HaHa_3_26]